MKPYFKLILSSLLVLIFSNSNVFAQQLDTSFLDSLPDNIKDDVLSTIAGGVDEEDEIYESKEASLEKIESSLSQIRSKISYIESNLDKADTRSKTTNLKRFGKEFFNTFQSTFSPLNEPNAGDNYLLDYGDTINVGFIGSTQTKRPYSLIVRRDGSITIPEVGKVFVGGLLLKDAAKLINETVGRTIVGAESYITLTNMRDIKVFVTGAVNNPGMYTLSGNSSVLSALIAAAGVSENGSYRNIIVKRDNEVISKIDLYQAFVFGNTKFNVPLRSGDAIIVSTSLPQATISGGVGHPAIYEFTSGETVSDLINMAQGFIPGVNLKTFMLNRINDDNSVSEISIANSELEKYQLKNGDSYFVDYYSAMPNPIYSVNIKGQVNKPGKYSIKTGQTLKDLVELAGGYTDSAYEVAGVLTRERAKLIEKEFNERLYQDMIRFLSSSARAAMLGSGQSSLPLLLSEFKNVKPQGRLTAEFTISRIEKDPSLDTLLEDGDEIFIPSYSQEVYVLGEVITPGARLYNSELSPKEYITKSGGIGKFGDKSRVIVISPNGDSYLASMGFLGSLVSGDELIIPGSVIYVPREIGQLDGLSYASAIAPIVSSLALSVASLNSID